MQNHNSQKIAEEWIAKLESRDYGYFNVLHCPDNDVFCGLTRLAYTVAICSKLCEHGYSERYCFDDYRTAQRELEEWHLRGFNDQRPVGWIACRGVSKEILVKSFEKYFPEGYASETLAFIKEKKQSTIGLFDDANNIASHLGLEVGVVKHHIAYLFAAGII